MEQNITITDFIGDYMLSKKDLVATLKELYGHFHESFEKVAKRECPPDETIRAAIYKPSKGWDFERIGKGLYLLKGAKTSAILVNGDSRKLAEIESQSIDLIITDHPWDNQKAHKAGNQKNFADYDTFRYTKEDFATKFRVLKPGSFCCEFLPKASETNREYLREVEDMAIAAGFGIHEYFYWQKRPTGKVNTGRSSKSLEQILVLYKPGPNGKCRKLHDSNAVRSTKTLMPDLLQDFMISQKDKNHQAEKPLALYKYLIENLSNEGEVCLDQFGGACNLLQAAIECNRWGIVYELSKEFVSKVVKRLGCITLYNPDTETVQTIERDISEPTIATSDVVEEVKSEIPSCAVEEPSVEVPIVETPVIEISSEDTKFHIDYLEKVIRLMPALVPNMEQLKNAILVKDAKCLYEIFDVVNAKGFDNYKKPDFQVDLFNYGMLKPFYEMIENEFEQKYPNMYTRSYYSTYKVELQGFAEYLVTIEKKTDVSYMEDVECIERYLAYIQKNFPLVKWEKTKAILENRLH